MNNTENMKISKTAIKKDIERFFKNTNNLLIKFNSKGEIYWCNNLWYELLGYSSKETIGESIFKFIYLYDLETFKMTLNKIVNGNIIPSFESRFINKKSDYNLIIWNLSYYPEDDFVYAEGKLVSLINNSDKHVQILEYFVQAYRENTTLYKSLPKLLDKISSLLSWNSAELWIKDPVSSDLKQIAFYYGDSKFIKNDKADISRIFNEISVNPEIKVIDKINEVPQNINIEIEETITTIAVPVPIKDNSFALLIINLMKKSPSDLNLIKIYENIASQLGNIIAEKVFKEELLKNDMLLEQAQKIARIASWEWDLENNKFICSDEFCDLFEIKLSIKNECTNFYQFIHEQDKQRVEKAVSSATKTGKLLNLEFSGNSSSGKKLDLILKAEPVKLTNGTVAKFVGTIQDITKLKETERALRRSEEYFRSMIENSLDIKTILNKAGKIRYISPSIEKILGYLPEELMGKSFIDFIHPHDLPHIQNVFADIIKMPGFTTSVEFRIRHKKGRWIIIQSLLKNLLNNPIVDGIIISSRDISSKKEAENSIKSLLAISEKLNSTLDVDVIMDILISEAINLVGAEGGCTGLRTTEGLTCKKYFNGDTSENFEFCWTPGVGLPGWLIENREPYISNDTANDPVVLQELVERFNIKSVACIPIMDMNNDVIGFLEVKNKLNHSEFNENDKDRLISLAQIASITIQNALAYQKIKMAEFQIKVSREQLRRLSAHLQSAREEERTRIAREIHDELGQSLTGLKMDISWLHKKMQNLGIDNPQLFEKTAGMSSLVDSTIKTVRKISSELRPGVLDYLGLPAAIEWQAQDFQNRTGIICNIIKLPKDLQLDQNKSTAIFRIFQETLTNIARHSQATEVDIELIREDERLILSIKDNGRGVTESELLNTRSFGILGMRERTLLLGGDFSIRGELNKGTTVLVKIPITGSNEGGGTL